MTGCDEVIEIGRAVPDCRTEFDEAGSFAGPAPPAEGFDPQIEQLRGPGLVHKGLRYSFVMHSMLH